MQKFGLCSRALASACSVIGRRVTLGAVALMMMISVSARAQVLPLMPSDAMVVFKIKNLQDLSTKAAVLIKDWGLDQMRPELADPLGSLLAITGMGAGLDKAGEVGVAIFPNPAGNGPPDVLGLVPVSDYKAFIAALPKATTAGDLTTFQPGGKPIFVTNWGKYAAISANQALATTKGQGIVAPPASAKELDSKDIIVFANMPVIRKQALPMFQMMKPMMLQQMAKGMQQAPNANPQMVALMNVYMGQILNAVEEFLTDSDGAVFGLTLSKDGISTALLADFRADSRMGKAFKGMKNASGSLTAGLPDSKYLFFGGAAVDPAGLQLLSEFTAPIEKAIADQGEQGKPMVAYFNAMKDYMAATKQVNFGMLTPPANAIQNGSGFIQAVSIVTGDPTKLVAATKSMMEHNAAVMAASGVTNFKTTMTPNAATLAGVSLDRYTTTMGEPQTPQEQQMAFIMQIIYGKNGPSGYMGKVADDKVIQTIGGDDVFATAAVTAASKNVDALAGGNVGAVTANLPKERLGAIYVSVDQIATVVLDVMAARGVPGGVKLPANLPPIGMTFGADGAAFRVDSYIPSTLVKSMVAAGLQLYLQQMPGGAQGGGL